jgi:hypothetical protein
MGVSNDMDPFDFNAHLQRLQELLAPYRDIWALECLHGQPHNLHSYPNSWLDQLEGLSHTSLWRLDSYRELGPLKGELRDYLEQLQRATRIPRFVRTKERLELSNKHFFRVKEKKHHEILALSDFLSTQNSKFSHLVDLGAGQGHLSRILTRQLGLKNCLCIERDPELIELGKNRLLRDQSDDPIDFVEHHYTGPDQLPKNIKDYLTKLQKTSVTLGLHTCGPLAIDHLSLATHYDQLSVLNLGCCYQRLKPEQANLSGRHQLEFTPYALTLATRAHGIVRYSDFCHKEKVKFYRYGLHFYTSSLSNDYRPLSVGDSPFRDYAGPFTKYCEKKWSTLQEQKELGLFRPEHARQWYLKAQTGQLLRRLLAANVLRWQLGRALEQVILADRALWLEDQGRKVNWVELFDENLSPRNIALWLAASS